jgi:hypothetical protein
MNQYERRITELLNRERFGFKDEVIGETLNLRTSFMVDNVFFLL